MTSINKREAVILRGELPNVHIVRTMKNKSKRGHYFCEESEQALKLLREIRRGEPLSRKQVR